MAKRRKVVYGQILELLPTNIRYPFFKKNDCSMSHLFDFDNVRNGNYFEIIIIVAMI